MYISQLSNKLLQGSTHDATKRNFTVKYLKCMYVHGHSGRIEALRPYKVKIGSELCGFPSEHFETVEPPLHLYTCMNSLKYL